MCYGYLINSVYGVTAQVDILERDSSPKFCSHSLSPPIEVTFEVHCHVTVVTVGLLDDHEVPLYVTLAVSVI
jgi:hypothetical protein